MNIFAENWLDDLAAYLDDRLGVPPRIRNELLDRAERERAWDLYPSPMDFADEWSRSRHPED